MNQPKNEEITEVDMSTAMQTLVDAIGRLEQRVIALEEFHKAQCQLNKALHVVAYGHQASIEALAQKAGIETVPQKRARTSNMLN